MIRVGRLGLCSGELKNCICNCRLANKGVGTKFSLGCQHRGSQILFPRRTHNRDVTPALHIVLHDGCGRCVYRDNLFDAEPSSSPRGTCTVRRVPNRTESAKTADKIPIAPAICLSYYQPSCRRSIARGFTDVVGSTMRCAGEATSLEKNASCRATGRSSRWLGKAGSFHSIPPPRS